MASPDKRKKDEPLVLLRLRKDLEKKQEALKISERSRNQLKKKVDELSKKHQQLKEEFQATFHGLNIEKDKLTTKVEEQGKLIEELKKGEHMKTKKMQKYVKHFMENDENKFIDIKKMTEENDKFKRFIEEKVKTKENQSANHIIEDGEDSEYWRRRYEGTIKESYIFYMLLDRYIEQNSGKSQLISTLTKETKLLADKDLQIWNLKQECQEKDTILAKAAIDMSVARAKEQVGKQSMSDSQGRNCGKHCYLTADYKELKNEMKALQGESLLMGERIRKLENDAFMRGRIAKTMRTKMKEIVFKSRGFDDTVVEQADDAKEFVILYEDFLKLTSKLEERIKMLEKHPLEKDERNKLSPTENARKKKTGFLGRILRKKT